jgi:hypothetical protein
MSSHCVVLQYVWFRTGSPALGSESGRTVYVAAAPVIVNFKPAMQRYLVSVTQPKPESCSYVGQQRPKVSETLFPPVTETV